MIDNYDSFTYNLVQYLGELGAEVEVVRNDAITVDEIVRARRRRHRDLAGPVHAERGGHLRRRDPALRRAGLPMLGVCLGHQSIGQAFGGRIVRARSIMHGKTSTIHHDGRGLFRGLPNPFEATRYHSLVIARASMPACLEISARTADGEIMGVRHRELPLEGVQFHPESILTVEGKALLANFLARCRTRPTA